MGCPCQIQLFALSQTEAQGIASVAIADVLRLESRYSRYRDDSLLSAINRVAKNGGEITVDDETASLLNYASACHQQSNGLFDITSGILRRAWRFDQAHIPAQSLLNSLLEKIGWHKLDWQPPLLRFPIPGMELDFGGIVKEYAADRAAQLCQQAGAKHGLINLGGDIKIIGPRADDRPWHIALGTPNPDSTKPIIISMYTGAVASSGDYERFLLINDRRYSHILNPKTGWPVAYLSATSVVAEFCVIAGSLATIGMLKETDGPGWLAESGTPYLWIDNLGQCGGPLHPKNNVIARQPQ